MYKMATCPSYSMLLPASRPAPNAVAKRTITTMTAEATNSVERQPAGNVDWSVHRKSLTAQHSEGVHVGSALQQWDAFFPFCREHSPKKAPMQLGKRQALSYFSLQSFFFFKAALPAAGSSTAYKNDVSTEARCMRVMRQ